MSRDWWNYQGMKPWYTFKVDKWFVVNIYGVLADQPRLKIIIFIRCYKSENIVLKIFKKIGFWDKKKSLDFRSRFLNINYRHSIKATLIFRFRSKLALFGFNWWHDSRKKFKVKLWYRKWIRKLLLLLDACQFGSNPSVCFDYAAAV